MASHHRFPPGVAAIDHVADVGLEIDAPDLASLLDRAAAGMITLITGGDEPVQQTGIAPPDGRPIEARETAVDTIHAARPTRGGPPGSPAPPAKDAMPIERRQIAVDTIDAAQLLADFLRELLYLYEVHRLEYAGARFLELDETRVRADVALAPASDSPIREIKGVTYHGLQAGRTPTGWHARVIFDV